MSGYAKITINLNQLIQDFDLPEDAEIERIDIKSQRGEHKVDSTGMDVTPIEREIRIVIESDQLPPATFDQRIKGPLPEIKRKPK